MRPPCYKYNRKLHYSSSISRCLARTLRLNSAGSLSQSSAASPFRGDELFIKLAQ